MGDDEPEARMNVGTDILTYPVRGDGITIFAICVGIALISNVASHGTPTLGFLAGNLLAGLLAAIFFEIIHSTALGSTEAPDFPDFTSVQSDILWPMLQIAFVVTVSFGPVIVYEMLMDEQEREPLLQYGLAALGMIYCPMAMLAVVVLGSLGSMSPHIVLPAIFRAGWLYWLVVIMICTLVIAELWLKSLIGDMLIVGPLLMAIFGIYLLMATGRALGIISRDRDEQLGWG